MKKLKIIMLIGLSILLLLLPGVYIYVQQPQFGKLPEGKRLIRVQQSPNYRDGAFQNRELTTVMSDDASYFAIFKKMIFSKTKPTKPIPSMKTDLKNLDSSQNILVWFGHSSYFMQIDGKRMLVDPVFSGNASPVSFTTKAFPGTDRYTVDDLPNIDFLFITHDHWDHLDYETILQLKSKVKTVICGLGTGAHLESWSFSPGSIIEKDWDESATLDSGFTVTVTTARHFSGRGFTRNQSLWASFVLQTPTQKIFIGGDGGYGKHFAQIGKTHGPFDLAILENGQYDLNWKNIHMLPPEVLQAAKELQAKNILPVHSAKFTLSNHYWNEPLTVITELNKTAKLSLLTPMIGEKVNLRDSTQTFKQWWVE